jgi:hypothetical protein
MKLTKILLSTLCAAALVFAFSSCSGSTTINVNTAANNANKSNKNVVSNANPAASATTAPNAVKPTPETTPKVSDSEIKIKGELQKGDAESLILYFGEESGDYAAYCFSNNSDAGRKILAACKDREQCEVTGETEAGSCKVPGLEADLSDSGRIVKASAAKSLGGKK